MTICFVSYWGINEGLTQSTVIPHVKILADMPQVKQVFLITIERKTGYKLPQFESRSIKFFPIDSSPSTVNKLKEKLKFNQLLRRLNSEQKLDLIITRGVLAAALCERMARKLAVPYTVESYEPHADYMIQDGIWKQAGLKYMVLKQSEKRQLKNAFVIHTVTERYRQSLIQAKEVDELKIKSVPCTADPALFQFNQIERKKVRSQLGVSGDTVVGLYTGKFGGIYLDTEAISLFLSVKNLFNQKGVRFYLIVLSPDHEAWKSNLLASGLLPDDFHIAFVSQQEVPSFCSAADFAFSLHRPKPSKIGISPIKNAEFLLSGLPIIIPEGIGDDSDLFKINYLGIVLKDFRSISQQDFELLNDLMVEDRLEGKIRKWALENRTYEMVAKAYHALLSEFN